MAAITNSMLYGVLPFWHTLIKNEIQPVIGLTIKVQLDNGTVSLVVYAENNKGYENILKISSAMETRELDLLPKKWLSAYREGLIAVYKADPLLSKDNLIELMAIFKLSCLFIGIERPSGKPTEEESFVREIAEELDIALTVYHECRYVDKEDAFAFEVLHAMDQSVKMTDFQRKNQSQTLTCFLTRNG